MQIASAASAFPKNYYPQKFLLEQLQQYWGEKLKNPQMLARLHRNVAVEGRHLALPYEQYYNLHTWGDANNVWIQVAQELGEQALCRALHHAGLEPKDLGALFFTSVTGISSPSIDALLINRIGLRCRSGGDRTGGRLCASVSIAGSGAGFGRAVLVDHPAGGSDGGEFDLV